MHTPRDDVYVPEVVQQRDRGRNCAVTCLVVGGVMLFSCCLSLLVVGIFWWSPALNQLAPQGDRSARSTENLELIAERAQLKHVLNEQQPVEQHPLYAQVVDLVERMRFASQNPLGVDWEQIMDYDRYTQEMFGQSLSLRINHFFDNSFKTDIRLLALHPPEFNDYEILHIESGPGEDVRVYLDMQTVYGFTEPFIWYLTPPNRLRIYDWLHVDYGIRNTTERAAIYSAEPEEAGGFKRYASASRDYLTSDKGFGEQTRQQRARSALKRCEDYKGPQQLAEPLKMIVARRWLTEGYLDRALKLATETKAADTVPGFQFIIGEVHRQRGNFKAAAEAYESYRSLVGPTPQVLERLANCYRELRDRAAERAVLEIATRNIRDSNLDRVVALMELNDQVQNRELFSKIARLPNSKTIFRKLLNAFVDSIYFADRSTWLAEYLVETSTDPELVLAAKFAIDANLENSVALLQQLHAKGNEADAERFDFWYAVREQDLLEILQQSPDKSKDFDTILELDDSMRSYTAQTMTQLCKLVLAESPENLSASIQLAWHYLDAKDYAAANEILVKLPEQEEDFAESTIRRWRLEAAYRLGDQQTALALANDPESARQLIELKQQNKDFADFDVLLERLDPESVERKWYAAVHAAQRAEPEAALSVLLDSFASSTQAIEFNRYDFRLKIIDICERLGQDLRPLELDPSPQMIEMTWNRNIRTFDWATCEQLLQHSLLEHEEGKRAFLRQQLAWHQGEYRSIVANADSIQDFLATYEAKEELDQLVRSALRSGEVGIVNQLAQIKLDMMIDHYNNSLAAAFARDWQRFHQHFHNLRRSEKSRIRFDEDLLKTSWHEFSPAQSDEYDSFSIDYAYELNCGLLVLVYSQPQSLDRDSLRTLFAAAFGNDVTVEPLGRNSGDRQAWVVALPNFRLTIDYDHWPADKLANSGWPDPLAECVRNGTQKIHFNLQRTEPTTEQQTYRMMEKIIELWLNEDLCVAAWNHSWLTASEVRRYFSRAATSGVSPNSLLFKPGELCGEPNYAVYYSAFSSQRDRTEYRPLVEALKEYEASTSSDRALLVNFSIYEINPELLTARVIGVKRNGFREVEVIVRMEADSQSCVAFKKGNVFRIPLTMIFDFAWQLFLRQQKINLGCGAGPSRGGYSY